MATNERTSTSEAGMFSRRSLLARAGAAAGVAGLLSIGGRAAATSDSNPASTPVSGSGPAAGSTSWPTDGPALAATVTGTLNLLNFSGWAGPTTYADFAAANPGASVNEIAWVSNDDTVTKAKDRAGDIDVALVDGTTFPRLAALGVLAPLGVLPNLENISSGFRGASWDPTNTNFAATDTGRTGILIDASKVTTAPTSWAEFFAMAKDHSGKVVILDYIRSVIGTTLLMLGKNPSSSEQPDLDAALAALKELKPHLLAISGEVSKTVVSGDAVMAMCDAYEAAGAIAANPTMKLQWIDPSEGQMGYLEGFVILGGPRNDLARAFVNFFHETTQYAAFVNAMSTPYVQLDNAEISEALRTSPVVNPPAEVVAKLHFHQFLGESQPIWDDAWDAFQSA